MALPTPAAVARLPLRTPQHAHTTRVDPAPCGARAGEIIPQSICSRYGLKVGAYSAGFVRVLMIVCSPIAWPIGKLLDYVLGPDHSVGGRVGRAGGEGASWWLQQGRGAWGADAEWPVRLQREAVLAAGMWARTKHTLHVLSPYPSSRGLLRQVH